MSEQPAKSVGDAYEAAGRRAAVALRGYSSAIVVAEDPSHAARVALGMARGEAAYRRVVVGDLTGNSAEIEALAPADDALGIYDSFTFGTSLKKVTRQVPGESNLNVLLGGTESVATREIIGSNRWQRLASEFARSDEMLILVAEELAPELAALASQMDGVVLVGNAKIPRAPEVNVLARIPAPLERTTPRKVAVAAAPEIAMWRRPPIIAVGGGAIVLLLIIALLFARGRSSDSTESMVTTLGDSTSDSVQRAAATLPAPANPADSANAAAYSVEILAANTAEGANFELQRHGSMMPAATISVVPIGETEAIWYKVYAGAFRDSAEAERLLRSLRRRGVVSDSAGSVTRAPLALRVDSVPAQGGVFARTREKVQSYSSKGLAVYALMQEDGSARLYSGAFASPSQSSLAATALRVAGLAPVLEYRTGRSQ